MGKWAWWHTCQVEIWVARTKVQNYIKEWWKTCAQLEHLWLAFCFHYDYKEMVLSELLSTTRYRPRLNTVHLRFTSSHGRSVCREGKMVHLCFPPYIRQRAPTTPSFQSKAAKHLLKACHILMRIRHQLLLHLFSAEGDEKPSKKNHILISAVSFSMNGFWM